LHHWGREAMADLARTSCSTYRSYISCHFYSLGRPSLSPVSFYFRYSRSRPQWNLSVWCPNEFCFCESVWSFVDPRSPVLMPASWIRNRSTW
jgi:hypothetical protein